MPHPFRGDRGLCTVLLPIGGPSPQRTCDVTEDNPVHAVPSCGRLHIGYRCTRRKGHDGLHQSRYADGTLMHSWMERRR